MRTEKQVLTGFIIVGWNNKQLLDECLSSVLNQTYGDKRVIYVDNGSTDESLVYVKKHYPQVITIDAGENLGFAVANNMGIKLAVEEEKCRYVALLNTDARISEDWLEKLVSFAELHPHSASFQSPTFDYYDHSVLDSYAITVDHCGRATQLGYRRQEALPNTRKVFGVNAAAALYSSAFLSSQPFGNDYFDSDLWMYLEDVDLAARATILGWDNWFVNESSAYHMGSATSNKNPGFSVYMVYRNNLPMLVKNLPFSILLRILPGLVLTDLKSLYQLWRGKNYRAFCALIKGRLFGLTKVPLFLRKHLSLSKHQRISTDQLWKLMNEM